MANHKINHMLVVMKFGTHCMQHIIFVDVKVVIAANATTAWSSFLPFCLSLNLYCYH